jgi:hypothetical protein
VRKRAIDRKLRGVEILPEMTATEVLSLPGSNELEVDESADISDSQN